ncbi:MAG: methylated-DNA--[protein]-cysteine S-methyltransferase [Verrucomicrobiota bacterium]|nr:methylated-DNA--[protein]-cysteine S-methyltransferase [Limisphaera sp.]MDW8382077.1 methylated-DNA--[protein]-cysteine S-methyltransferase [Verrucomicrobiota bacterium]
MVLRVRAVYGPLALETQWGIFAARYSEHGLIELLFPSSKRSTFVSLTDVPQPVRSWHVRTSLVIRALLQGRKTDVPEPPLDWSAATAFQRQVWAALRNIPIGEVRTYGDVARAIGQPKGARAVGGACSKNPIPLLVPCHRVIAANGRLGGFQPGQRWKRQLLKVEIQARRRATFGPSGDD